MVTEPGWGSKDVWIEQRRGEDVFVELVEDIGHQPATPLGVGQDGHSGMNAVGRILPLPAQEQISPRPPGPRVPPPSRSPADTASQRRSDPTTSRAGRRSRSLRQTAIPTRP